MSDVPLVLVVPFALLLLLIAVMPLTAPRAKHLWDRYYPYISVGLALLVALAYILKMPSGPGIVLRTAHDYFSFISLIGSLFVISGGIHIRVKGEATPMANLVFLLLGAFFANIIGTTGASMVLIRPWIRMNKIRMGPYHVVFFIFVVSNVGGALTPVGDPPLFLGFLHGVPFFWLIQHVFLGWLGTLGLILTAFFFFDRRSFRRMPKKMRADISTHEETWRFQGAPNVLLLLIVVGAVFLPPIPLLREAVMLGAAAASWFLTPKVIHEENHFTLGPIREVALLFIGIFGTMMPVLDYLSIHAVAFGFDRPIHYYFVSGLFSSVLDNAPTYLNFFQLALSTAQNQAPALYHHLPNSLADTAVLLNHRPLYVVAVSLGSVFFGAMTYIGNGPNFMVKAIAHDAGVHCPNFFQYIVRYSLPILFPILAISGFVLLGR